VPSNHPAPDQRRRVLLGVDAGASHCTVVVAHGGLDVLARADGPAAAMKPGGGAASAAVIADVARRVAAAANVPLPADFAVVGAAGAGRTQERDELAAALVSTGVTRAARVLPDGEVALRAAFASQPGILLNAGTGSVAFARDASGHIHRSGGFGWQLGDEGGGYWLGQRALDAAARAEDGRGEGSTLLARLLGALGLRRFDDLVRWAATATPTQVAALAPHVLNAALEGEPVAQHAMQEAARELGGLVVTLARHFPAGEEIPVALTGGLLVPNSPLTVALTKALAHLLPRARIVPTHVDAAAGALQLAELG